MWKWLKIVFFLQLLFFAVSSCIDKSDDPYFARPDWLASPIYQNLQEQGNFTMFLKCVDKTLYADVLKRAGYFTVFAPNDSAFSVYLQNNNLSSVDDIDVEKVIDIVSYSMVFTAFTYHDIDDAHTASGDLSNDIAYRRKTNNYKGVYKETTPTLGEVNVVDINWVLDADFIDGSVPSLYTDDNNYKKLTILTSDYFNRRGLTAYDYNYFFSSVVFKGFNVHDANVVKRDIMAENGYIHVVDKVLEPLENLEEQLVGKDEFSMFKNILDKYLRNYNIAPADFLDKYSKATGNQNPVYVKSYPWLKFALNTENFDPGSTVGEDQYNSFTLFAPNNEAVQTFLDDKFLKYYKSLDDMSEELISDFVNSHLFTTTVWPSQFETAETRFTEQDIISKKMVSNGLFYGTKRVQESDNFFTVYGEINLNPKYSLMLRGLKDNGLDFLLKNTSQKYSVFMVSDSVMMNEGFSYDNARSSWSHVLLEDSVEVPSSTPNEDLNRFLRLHIIRETANQEIADLSERNMILTYGNEYIKQENGNVYAAGNYDLGDEPIPVLKDETPNNGITYKLSETPLHYSTRNPIEDIEELGDDYSKFYKYLTNSQSLYDADNMKLKDLNGGDPNTIFVVNNANMTAARKAGLLPISTNPSDSKQQQQVKDFIRYHFVVGKSLAQGIVTNGEFPTALKDDLGNRTYVNIISDEFGNISAIDRAGSDPVLIHSENNNILSNRVVIHELDGYLNPNEKE